MNNKPERVGNFTSSENVALVSNPMPSAKKEGAIFGKPALTYIEECNMERKLEKIVPQLLGEEYIMSCEETTMHHTIKCWAGSKDGMKMDEGKTIVELKCPLTLKSFCQLVDPLYNGFTGMDAINIIRETHKHGEKFYWQIVSNACIDNAKYGELIVYMPYLSELEVIKKIADGQQDCYWITMAMDDELPYLIENKYYRNLNILRFEIPQSDKDFLTNRVLEAGKMLIDIK